MAKAKSTSKTSRASSAAKKQPVTTATVKVRADQSPSEIKDGIVVGIPAEEQDTSELEGDEVKDGVIISTEASRAEAENGAIT